MAARNTMMKITESISVVTELSIQKPRHTTPHSVTERAMIDATDLPKHYIYTWKKEEKSKHLRVVSRNFHFQKVCHLV